MTETAEPTPSEGQPSEPVPAEMPQTEEESTTTELPDTREDNDNGEEQRQTTETETTETYEETEREAESGETDTDTEQDTIPTPPLQRSLTLTDEPLKQSPFAIDDPLNPDYEKMMADENLTEESLQQTLNAYAEAIRQEFEEATKAQDNLDNVEEYTRDYFKKNIHSAAAQIVWLANNADSESVRLKAATTVVHEALADARADGDPIKNLLKELTAKPESAPSN